MAYTTADLIADVKAGASIPTSQNLFTNADFLRLANKEMELGIVPMILGTREEFFVTHQDYSIQADKAEYAIPKRAIGEKLRDVQVVNGTNLVSMPRLEPEFIGASDAGREGFYLRGGRVVLQPIPKTTAHTLRLSYFKRPGRLVEVSACGRVQSIDTGLNQVTLTGAPPSTFNNNVKVDFVKSEPGFENSGIDYPISAISGSVLTFASLPADLEVGDYVCLAGESPIPQIPVELHTLLAQMVIVRCLQAQGRDAKTEQDKLDRMIQAALILLTPRVDGEPRKITAPNTLLNYFRRGW